MKIETTIIGIAAILMLVTSCANNVQYHESVKQGRLVKTKKELLLKKEKSNPFSILVSKDSEIDFFKDIPSQDKNIVATVPKGTMIKILSHGKGTPIMTAKGVTRGEMKVNGKTHYPIIDVLLSLDPKGGNHIVVNLNEELAKSVD